MLPKTRLLPLKHPLRIQQQRRIRPLLLPLSSLSPLPKHIRTLATGIDADSVSIPEHDRSHASFYISNVLPIRLGALDPRPALARVREEALLEQLNDIASELAGAHGFRVESWEVARKDGGVFCHFSYSTPQEHEVPLPTRADDFHAPESPHPDPTSPASLFLPLLVKAADKHGGWPSWIGSWWSEWMNRRNPNTRATEDAGHRLYRGFETISSVGGEEGSEEVQVKGTLTGYQKLAGLGKVWIVRGRQWTEDMNRFPSSRLRVEFDGPDVSQEMLYTLFRPYGRLMDIQPPTPVPAGSLRFALLSFSRTEPSVIASNCLHGFSTPTKTADYDLNKTNEVAAVPLSRLRIYYERPLKAHAFRDWVSAHPRIALPIMAFLIGTLSYTFFDPIRAFFIRSKVEGIWNLDQYSVVKSLRQLFLPISSTFSRGGSGEKKKDDEGLGRAAWKDRVEAEHNVERWLSEYPSTFIVISGPPGSGKHDLVNRVIKQEQKPSLVIDCAEIAKAKSDQALVSTLADQTGYWPVFSFLSSLNGLIDLASVGLIGQKAGFSTPVDQQLRSMLEIAGSALKDVSTHAQDERVRASQCRDDEIAIAADRERRRQLILRGAWHDGRLDCVAGNGVMSELGLGSEPCSEGDLSPPPAPMIANIAPIEGEGVPPTVASLSVNDHALDTAQTKKLDSIELDAEGELIKTLPIVVLQNFGVKAARGDLWNVLAEWSASLIENRVAHVIIVGEGSAATKTLTRALPSKPLNAVALADADADNSLAFVQEKLSSAIDLSAEDRQEIAKLGGRMVDLELLVYKVRSGQSIYDAVNEIILRNVVELRKLAFGDDSDDAKNLPWTRPQAWKIVQELAKKGETSYPKLLQDFPFKGCEPNLKALEEHELVSIAYVDGRASRLRAGKPVFRHAFEELVNDAVFRASCQIEYNTAIINKAEAEIRDIEGELARLKDIAANGGDAALGVTESGWLGLTKHSAIKGRAQWLLAKLGKSVDKLVALEADNAEQMKVLSSGAA